MKKYTEPKIEIQNFNTENIITSSGILPSEITGYVSADEKVAINTSAAYIMDFNE